jgi:hypothetical protein
MEHGRINGRCLTWLAGLFDGDDDKSNRCPLSLVFRKMKLRASETTNRQTELINKHATFGNSVLDAERNTQEDYCQEEFLFPKGFQRLAGG